MSVLNFDNVSVSLQGKDIVNNVSFKVPKGKFLALLGPNGAGKTTLLKAASGLAAYSGSLTLFDKELNLLTPHETGHIISYVPQGADVHWPMCVRDIVALGRLPYHRGFAINETKDQNAINTAIEILDLSQLTDRSFNALSGGEKSRVMLGRALATEPKILLADEPTAALDPYHQLQILNVMQRMTNQGVSVVTILHDIFLAAQFADIVVLLHHGQVIAFGKPEEVLTPKILKRVYNISLLQDIQFGRGLWEQEPK